MMLMLMLMRGVLYENIIVDDWLVFVLMRSVGS
jgi:hypothetical protein